MPESSGGFGAPSPSTPPAGGGFGAPAGGAPAGGGFGAPAGGAPAGGGFGAPAGGAPAGGGFGAPAGGAPAGGGDGGFGGAPAAGAPAGAAADGESKSKLPYILGGCCLLIVLLTCAFGGYAYWKASQAIDEVTGGDGLMGSVGRMAISAHLASVYSTCQSDPSGASASGSFNPAVFANYQSIACQVPATGAQIAQDGNRSQIAVSDDGRAAALGLDPSSCSTLTAGQSKFVLCNGLLVHIENPGQME